jgi:hypothetical protein
MPDLVKIGHTNRDIEQRIKEIDTIEYDKEKFNIRRKIENFVAIIKENKCLALRYEKSDLSFRFFVALYAIKYNLC